jgi:hypothetical protein
MLGIATLLYLIGQPFAYNSLGVSVLLAILYSGQVLPSEFSSFYL